MIDTYHVGEAYPPGRVDKVTLWRTPDGYFGLITPKGGHSIPFENYPSWGSIKSDLVRCLREELECPEFERQLGPPFLDYTLVRLVNALDPVLKLAVAPRQ